MTIPTRPVSGLAGSRVLVVGSGKMAVATAAAALDAGADVTLSAREPHRAAAATTGLAGMKTAVADPEDAAQAFGLVHDNGPFDHIGVLAGGARISSAYGIGQTTLETAQASFARFWLSYNLLRAAAVQVRPGGSVTLLSGSSSRRPSAGRGFWGSLHGAIEALARNAAYELAPLRVNAVSPGGIGVTPLNLQLIEHAGQPEDVAAMVLALMANPAVTGTVVDVDGGEFLGSVTASGEPARGGS
jgi:threonine dehydrogenase-like Zn-dependent dehydrogenase